MNATLGYARVSTAGQELDAQLAALGAAGVDDGRAFTDKLSATKPTKVTTDRQEQLRRLAATGESVH